MSLSAVECVARGVVWNAHDMAYDCIAWDKVRDDETLFFVLARASMVESGSDLYTSLLVNYFGDSAASTWLRERWEQDELQHGLALLPPSVRDRVDRTCAKLMQYYLSS